MIADLKPYPAMKDSGVSWLGEVPEHWDTRKLKYAVTFSGGGTPSKAEASYWQGGIPWVSPKDMTGLWITDAADHISEAAVRASATSIVEPGALLVVVRSGILRRTIPVAINTVEVAINQDMKALRPRCGVVQSEYLRAVIRGNERSLLAEWTKQGATVESIEHELLAGSRIALPPLPEQAAIVCFLDHADRRIRRYIRAQQKLVKLLEEQKQAIIHRAVTRGLDPNVRLKPSGVEWLGDVPEHWEVVRSKRVFVPRTELASPGDVQLSATQAYGVISQEEYERRVGRKIVKIFRHLEKRRHVEVDDFVISMRSFQGGLERAWERGCIRSSYVVLRPNRDVCVPYFARLFKSPGYIGALQATANFIRDGQDLNYRNFCAVDLPWPPLDEQSRIAEAIEKDLETSLTAGKRAAQEIELLREYRTRLIADVVTGKLDVREAAARLPDEAEEPEPLDEIEAGDDLHEGAADADDELCEEAEA